MYLIILSGIINKVNKSIITKYIKMKNNFNILGILSLFYLQILFFYDKI